MDVSPIPSIMNPGAFQRAMLKMTEQARDEQAARTAIPSGTSIAQAADYWSMLAPKTLGSMFDAYA